MILSIILIALLGGIAYFHYAQGFFSATLSAVCAVVAAVIAVGYHEVAVNSLLQGAAGDYATGLCLAAIFALIYIVLRLIFDKAVPGNIRLPVMVDRVGGAAMGVVAGVFTAGIVALVAQMLPFGPAVASYARFAVEDRPEVAIPAKQSGGRMRDADIHAQMTEDSLAPEKRSSLMLPVDDWVLATVNALSNGGSMAGSQVLADVHPNYPDELYGQRVGLQIGAKRTAMNLPGKSPQVTLAEPGLFRVDADFKSNAIDGELPQLHQRAVTYARNPNALQLVVRLVFGKDAADKASNLVRVSTGNVRLVAGGQNYWPIGTVEAGKTLFLNKPDDFLFVDTEKSDGAIDFLFVVEDPSGVVVGGAKDPAQTIKEGVFVEAKRLARIDLSGKEVLAGIKPTKQAAVVRKPDLAKSSKKQETAIPAATEFAYESVLISNKLFSPVNTGTPDPDVNDAQTQSGTLSMTKRHLTKLAITPTQSLAVLAQGSNAVDDLYVAAGKKLVQIKGAPPAEGGDPWAWGSLSQWQLVDAAGNVYRPSGGWAKVSQDRAERMAAVYNGTGNAPDVTQGEGRPVEVWIAFTVPDGTQLKQVKFNNKLVTELDQAVP